MEIKKSVERQRDFWGLTLFVPPQTQAQGLPMGGGAPVFFLAGIFDFVGNVGPGKTAGEKITG